MLPSMHDQLPSIPPGTVEKARQALGPGVEAIEVKVGLDSTGDPAVWAWIILDESCEAPWAFENREKLRMALIDQFRAAGVREWVYVGFRGAGEIAAG